MSDLQPEEIVKRLRQTINKGKMGKDYTIIPRDKNNLLREKYLIDDSKIKAILLDITVDDYICSDDSINEDYPDDVVHVFDKNVHLIPRYSENIEREQVRLYIKFTWTKAEYGNLIFISFHEWEGK